MKVVGISTLAIGSKLEVFNFGKRLGNDIFQSDNMFWREDKIDATEIPLLVFLNKIDSTRSNGVGKTGGAIT